MNITLKDGTPISYEEVKKQAEKAEYIYVLHILGYYSIDMVTSTDPLQNMSI